MLKGKASLRLNARDPFNWQYYRGFTQYGNIDITIRNRWDNRHTASTLLTALASSRASNGAEHLPQKKSSNGGCRWKLILVLVCLVSPPVLQAVFIAGFLNIFTFIS